MKKITNMDIEFIKIPEGNFFMGSNKADELAEADEEPQRRVWLSEYQIQKVPVTVGQWKVFLKESKYQWPMAEWKKEMLNDKEWGSRVLRDNYPIIYVSWFDSYEFTKWLSVREGKNYSLPTEAQWEKACRGTTQRVCASDYKYDLLNWEIRSCSVGNDLLNASPYGCLDMNANIYEWCWDWYDSEYYEYMPLLNPKGPLKGQYKAARSGPRWGNERCCRRGYRNPNTRCARGFRMVLL